MFRHLLNINNNLYIVIPLRTTMNRTATKQAINKKIEYYEHGRLFEQYIIALFSQKSFKLKKWRQSKFISRDTFISDISYPDLELIFMGKRNYKFAVECKWRKNFYKGKINWATTEQISIYQQFQNKYSMPVFVAIGIGGDPSNPDKLFVTPLCNISTLSEIFEGDLIPYKRKTTSNFFYDTVQLRLF